MKEGQIYKALTQRLRTSFASIDHSCGHTTCFWTQDATFLTRLCTNKLYAVDVDGKTDTIIAYHTFLYQYFLQAIMSILVLFLLFSFLPFTCL